MFENDVKIYGIKTQNANKMKGSEFENDVKIYGIKTKVCPLISIEGLRMM